jgi:hypothetical protein
VVLRKRTPSVVNPQYYVEKKTLEENAEAGKCIICHNPLGKRMRKYCSKACFDAWFLKFNPPFRWRSLRRKAMRRDRWRCVACGMSKKDMNAKYAGTRYSKSPKMFVDHIVPVSLNGPEFDLANLQTLCMDCNRKKTKNDMGDIAIARRKGNSGSEE